MIPGSCSPCPESATVRAQFPVRFESGNVSVFNNFFCAGEPHGEEKETYPCLSTDRVQFRLFPSTVSTCHEYGLDWFRVWFRYPLRCKRIREPHAKQDWATHRAGESEPRPHESPHESPHEWAHKWNHKWNHESAHESAHDSTHEGWFSLFSALQGPPTKAPTKRPTKAFMEVPMKVSTQVVRVHLSCFHLFCSSSKDLDSALQKWHVTIIQKIHEMFYRIYILVTTWLH